MKQNSVLMFLLFILVIFIVLLGISLITALNKPSKDTVVYKQRYPWDWGWGNFRRFVPTFVVHHPHKSGPHHPAPAPAPEEPAPAPEEPAPEPFEGFV